MKNGAEGDRTPDLMTASHALSHLSYSPIKGYFLQKDRAGVNIKLQPHMNCRLTKLNLKNTRRCLLKAYFNMQE